MIDVIEYNITLRPMKDTRTISVTAKFQQHMIQLFGSNEGQFFWSLEEVQLWRAAYVKHNQPVYPRAGVDLPTSFASFCRHAPLRKSTKLHECKSAYDEFPSPFLLLSCADNTWTKTLSMVNRFVLLHSSD